MTDHYFSETPGVPDRRRTVKVAAWGHDLGLTAAAGVFAGESLDKATGILLRHTQPPAEGATVLDLGCGWGPIACAIAVASPKATVWGTDVNQRALELTEYNAEQLGVTVHTSAPDDVPDDVRFDAIWSNPPVRIGKRAMRELLVKWLERLTPDGRAHLVVGKNLGADSLQTWLTEQGWPTYRDASEKGFRVLNVRRG